MNGHEAVCALAEAACEDERSDDDLLLFGRCDTQHSDQPFPCGLQSIFFPEAVMQISFFMAYGAAFILPLWSFLVIAKKEEGMAMFGLVSAIFIIAFCPTL